MMRAGLAVVLCAVACAAPAEATTVTASKGDPASGSIGAVDLGSEVNRTVMPLTRDLSLPAVNAAVTVAPDARSALVTATSGTVLPLGPLTGPVFGGTLPVVTHCKPLVLLKSVSCATGERLIVTGEGSIVGDRVSITTPAYVTFWGFAGNDALSVRLTPGVPMPEWFETGQLLGGSGSDTLTVTREGTDRAISLQGEAGADVYNGSPGKDVVELAEPAPHARDTVNVADGDNLDVIACPDPTDVINKDPGDAVVCGLP